MTDAYTITVALGGTWSGRSGVACCPAHDDRTPSLSLTDAADGRLLLTCHAGCDFRDIIDALRGRGLIAGRGSFKPLGEICRAERRKAERAYKEKRARLARRVAVDIRRRQHLIQLSELIFVIAFSLLNSLRRGCGAENAQQADKRELVKAAQKVGRRLRIFSGFCIDHGQFSRIALRLD